jgi:hypothetical protein
LINCQKCRHPVMASTVSGLPRHIDISALTMAGELAALLEGRATFSLYGERLWRRNAEQIASGRRDYPVFREHRCGPAVPDEQVDSVWMETAMAIVIHACGGVIVSSGKIAFEPPF